VQETLHQITLLVKANTQETWVTALKLQLLAVWIDGNLALYPSSTVFLQIAIQQVRRGLDAIAVLDRSVATIRAALSDGLSIGHWLPSLSLPRA
jgi:hypothetical protein